MTDRCPQAFSQNSIPGRPFSTRKLDKYANAENRTFLGKLSNFNNFYQNTVYPWAVQAWSWVSTQILGVTTKRWPWWTTGIWWFTMDLAWSCNHQTVLTIVKRGTLSRPWLVMVFDSQWVTFLWTHSDANQRKNTTWPNFLDSSLMIIMPGF